MGVRWSWLTGILIVLVFLTVLATADSAGGGKMTADAAGPGQGGVLQAAMPDLPGAVSALQGTAAGVTNSPAKEVYRTRLVLLGTTGGVTFYPDSDRASSSSALVVGDTLYIIDMGQGSSARLSKAFNEGKFVESPGGRIQDGSSTFLSHAKALFFTHLHQDHTADYPVLLLTGPGAGLGMVTDPATNKTVRVPLKVFGPGNRGQLEADRTGYLRRGGQIVSTDSADILVHEVIDPAWIDQKFGTPEPGSPMAALKTHMLESHTTPAEAGQVATDCGVRTLVLNHIVPGNTPDAHLQEAQKTFSGTLVIGEDLMEIGMVRAA